MMDGGGQVPMTQHESVLIHRVQQLQSQIEELQSTLAILVRLLNSMKGSAT